MWSLLQLQKKNSIDVSVVCSPNVAHNRNLLVRDFLSGGSTHLLFLDDDVVPPADLDLKRLIDLDKDVIVLPCPINMTMDIGSNYQWNVFPERGKTTNIRGSGLKRIWAAGTGCMLIKREVLEKIEIPFQFMRDEDERVEFGEDYMFCQKVRTAGYQIWADWDNTCGHFKDTDIREFL